MPDPEHAATSLQPTAPHQPHSVGGAPTIAAVHTLSVGQRLGELEITHLLGRGGMGEVYRARDLTAERDVVVKVLPRELAANADEMARVRESFGRVHALQHEHICPLYSLGHDPAVGYFVVMKFLPGETLSAYRRRVIAGQGAFTLDDALRVLRPVAAALDYAHRQRVVHRDVKPQNVLVDPASGDVQVVDFGLAADIRTSMTRVSMVQMDSAGTYPYMAPEQWRGQYQDGSTDQYALAVVAYELLTGRMPDEAPDSAILMRCVLEEPAPPLPDHPEHVGRAVARGMAKGREERFGSCTEFLDALAGEAAGDDEPDRKCGFSRPKNAKKSPTPAVASPAAAVAAAPADETSSQVGGRHREARLMRMLKDIAECYRYIRGLSWPPRIVGEVLAAGLFAAISAGLSFAAVHALGHRSGMMVGGVPATAAALVFGLCIWGLRYWAHRRRRQAQAAIAHVKREIVAEYPQRVEEWGGARLLDEEGSVVEIIRALGGKPPGFFPRYTGR